MSKIKKISFILIMLVLSGCSSERAVIRYLPTISGVGKFSFGGWIVAVQKDSTAIFTLSGELIACEGHQLFILDSQQVNIIPDSSVISARLYIYRNQPGVFAIITVVGLLPSIIAAIAVPEFAGAFLALGLAPLFIGSTFTITEAVSKRNQLIFPERNSLKEFSKFSRFPQGIPAGLNINQLKLPY